ncbi:heavy-metal-associated domain-containing protein [Streptomyces litchfieldiae]|uniref:Heavy-metal-associated domain-containing protein n=1 Tax=Streptomyces litchfieldiae TaxID=3075543 RepID=A0ABU2MMV6_9ACTN|nr:heavy-metal-associated domain-containing protein [Streptomyces sp. DSM 44938]MDT0342941.1 heavy-metal-associated domain-containing protein [Streptomyces sp. DSM 44938]
MMTGESNRHHRNEACPMSTTTYKVSGMTCGHCEGAVRAEIGALPGVTEVTAAAGTGLVTVTAEAPPDDDAVRAAVDEAGYELIGRA